MPEARRRDRDEAAARPRVAYFGGSFDPVHAGHVSIANQVRESEDLDEIVFLLAARSPFKRERPATADEHRLAMLRRVLPLVPGSSLDARELARPAPSFTVDTMEAVHRERPDADLHFLVGRDHVESLARWHRAERLAELVTFLVVARDGDPRPDLDRLPAAFRTRFVATRPHPASSTEIRGRLRRGEPVDDLLPAAVAAYARAQGLYSARNRDAT